MPAIMPPINPNIIAALGQYFGGMQNRTIRTPPFVRPGSTAQRGEVLGRPSMPTPGMPQVIPQPVGGPAPTAPGAAPSPRSLGDELARIPKQPTLIPRGGGVTPAAPAAPPTLHPGAQMVPEGFSEVTGEGLEGGRRLVSPEGVEYTYDKAGDLIRVDAPPGVEAPPLPGSTAPAAAQGAAPPEEDTPRAATQRGIKSTIANELGGHTDEDYDGTKYVYDNNAKLVKTIAPPGGSPVTGTQPGGGGQAPASMPQQKRGVWSTLTDPSLAGIALAAGQQMTRARYPGESGIGNAVNAVTAGYNTLAQQRQMQYAREQAAREQQMKQAKQDQDIAESKSRAEQNRAQAERYGKQTEHEERQDKLDKIKENNAETQRRVDEVFKNANLTLEQQKAAAQQLMYENQKANLDLQYALAERNAIAAQKRHDEDVRHNKQSEATEQSRVELERARVDLQRIKAAKDKVNNIDVGDVQAQARQNVLARHSVTDIPPNVRSKPAGTPAEFEAEMKAEVDKLIRERQELGKPATPAADPSKGVLTTSLPPVPGEDTKTTNIGTMVLRQGKWLRYVPATQ